MAAASNSTPLIALDAVAIDTETTGIDPRKARIVEIGGVRLVGGRLDESQPFRRLVQPGTPIPRSATGIHGIDAAAVANAPRFAEAWPQLASWLGDTVVIGHTLGFDLAVLRRECERAGIAWRPLIALDIQLLAQVAEPELAGYALEDLAAWLGIETKGRHSAVGDAIAAGRIFCALVPKLRERRVRTLAEAMHASRTHFNAIDGQRRAGWAADVIAHEAATPADLAVERIDSYPYRHRVEAIMTSPARSVPPETSIGAALQRMSHDRISSLFVARTEHDSHPMHPGDTGIMTERDVLRALGAHGAAALEQPVSQAMSRPLATVPADAFAYVAIGRMNRLKVRHLGVTDATGHVVGALSARDLLRLRAEGAVELGDEINQANDVHRLAAAWAKLTSVASALAAESLSARDVAAVISHQVAELTRRACVLAEQSLQQSGRGDPPCPYAFVVLGSAGRGESLLAMDQDNALVFADGAPDGADSWFEALAIRVAAMLHDVGVPYCKGGVMAKNPQWRGSLAVWRERIDDWVRRSNPQDLMSLDIFFDLYGVHGEAELADTLWRGAFDAAKGNASFAKLLIEAAGAIESGRNWFGGIRTEEGRIDLKKAGLFGIVSAARALAICHHVVEHSTPARLNGIKALRLGSEGDLDALIDAQGVFLDLLLKQQLDDAARGRPPSNAVEAKPLSRKDRERLLAALRSVEHLDELARDLIFGR